VVAQLARYDWPGNVRELRNVARRLVTPRGQVAMAALVDEIFDLPAASPAATPLWIGAAPASAPKKARRRFRHRSDVTQEELLTALKAHRWHLTSVAAELKVSRSTLYRLVESCPGVRKAAEVERQEIAEALRRCSGDVDAAAAQLQVSVQGLRLRLAALGLKPEAQ
jgi:two-component system nitrogen regulation response regulator GlnG